MAYCILGMHMNHASALVFQKRVCISGKHQEKAGVGVLEMDL